MISKTVHHEHGPSLMGSINWTCFESFNKYVFELESKHVILYIGGKIFRADTLVFPKNLPMHSSKYTPSHKPHLTPPVEGTMATKIPKLAASAQRQINAVVVSSGLMSKTVKVRIGLQKWNKHIGKVGVLFHSYAIAILNWNWQSSLQFPE